MKDAPPGSRTTLVLLLCWLTGSSGQYFTTDRWIDTSTQEIAFSASALKITGSNMLFCFGAGGTDTSRCATTTRFSSDFSASATNLIKLNDVFTLEDGGATYYEYALIAGESWGSTRGPLYLTQLLPDGTDSFEIPVQVATLFPDPEVVSASTVLQYAPALTLNIRLTGLTAARIARGLLVLNFDQTIACTYNASVDSTGDLITLTRTNTAPWTAAATEVRLASIGAGRGLVKFSSAPLVFTVSASTTVGVAAPASVPSIAQDASTLTIYGGGFGSSTAELQITFNVPLTLGHDYNIISISSSGAEATLQLRPGKMWSKSPRTELSVTSIHVGPAGSTQTSTPSNPVVVAFLHEALGASVVAFSQRNVPQLAANASSLVILGAGFGTTTSTVLLSSLTQDADYFITAVADGSITLSLASGRVWGSEGDTLKLTGVAGCPSGCPAVLDVVLAVVQSSVWVAPSEQPFDTNSSQLTIEGSGFGNSTTDTTLELFPLHAQGTVYDVISVTPNRVVLELRPTQWWTPGTLRLSSINPSGRGSVSVAKQISNITRGLLYMRSSPQEMYANAQNIEIVGSGFGTNRHNVSVDIFPNVSTNFVVTAVTNTRVQLRLTKTLSDSWHLGGVATAPPSTMLTVSSIRVSSGATTPIANVTVANLTNYLPAITSTSVGGRDSPRLLISGSNFCTDGIELSFDNLLSPGINYTIASTTTTQIELLLQAGYWSLTPATLSVTAMGCPSTFGVSALATNNATRILDEESTVTVSPNPTNLIFTTAEHLTVYGSGFGTVSAQVELTLSSANAGKQCKIGAAVLAADTMCELVSLSPTVMIIGLKDTSGDKVSWLSEENSTLLTVTSLAISQVSSTNINVTVAQLVTPPNVDASSRELALTASSVAVKGSGFGGLISELELRFTPSLVQGWDYEIGFLNDTYMELALKTGREWRSDGYCNDLYLSRMSIKSYGMARVQTALAKVVPTPAIVSSRSRLQSAASLLQLHGLALGTSTSDLQLTFSPSLTRDVDYTVSSLVAGNNAAGTLSTLSLTLLTGKFWRSAAGPLMLTSLQVGDTGLVPTETQVAAIVLQDQTLYVNENTVERAPAAKTVVITGSNLGMGTNETMILDLSSATALVKNTDYVISSFSNTEIVLTLISGKLWSTLSDKTYALTLNSISFNGGSTVLPVSTVVATIQTASQRVDATITTLPLTFPYLVIEARPRKFASCEVASSVSFEFNQPLVLGVDYEVIDVIASDKDSVRDYILALKTGKSWAAENGTLLCSSMTCSGVGEVAQEDPATTYIQVATLVNDVSSSIVVDAAATKVQRKVFLNAPSMDNQLSVLGDTLEIMGRGFGSSIDAVTAIDLLPQSQSSNKPTFGIDFYVEAVSPFKLTLKRKAFGAPWDPDWLTTTTGGLQYSHQTALTITTLAITGKTSLASSATVALLVGGPIVTSSVLAVGTYSPELVLTGYNLFGIATGVLSFTSNATLGTNFTVDECFNCAQCTIPSCALQTVKLKLLHGPWGTTGNTLVIDTIGGTYGTTTGFNNTVRSIVSPSEVFVNSDTSSVIYQTASDLKISGGGFGTNTSAVTVQITGLSGFAVSSVLSHEITISIGSMSTWGTPAATLTVTSVTVAGSQTTMSVPVGTVTAVPVVIPAATVSYVGAAFFTFGLSGVCADTSSCAAALLTTSTIPTLEFSPALVLGIDYYWYSLTTTTAVLGLHRQRRWRSDTELPAGSSFNLQLVRVGLPGSSIAVSSSIGQFRSDLRVQSSTGFLGKYADTLDISGLNLAASIWNSATSTVSALGLTLTFEPELILDTDYSLEAATSTVIRVRRLTAWNQKPSETDYSAGTFPALTLKKVTSASYGEIVVFGSVADIVDPTAFYVQPRTLNTNYLRVRSASELDIEGNGFCGGNYTSTADGTCLGGNLTFGLSATLTEGFDYAVKSGHTNTKATLLLLTNSSRSWTTSPEVGFLRTDTMTVNGQSYTANAAVAAIADNPSFFVSVAKRAFRATTLTISATGLTVPQQQWSAGKLGVLDDSLLMTFNPSLALGVDYTIGAVTSQNVTLSLVSGKDWRKQGDPGLLVLESVILHGMGTMTNFEQEQSVTVATVIEDSTITGSTEALASNADVLALRGSNLNVNMELTFSPLLASTAYSLDATASNSSYLILNLNPGYTWAAVAAESTTDLYITALDANNTGTVAISTPVAKIVPGPTVTESFGLLGAEFPVLEIDGSAFYWDISGITQLNFDPPHTLGVDFNISEVKDHRITLRLNTGKTWKGLASNNLLMLVSLEIQGTGLVTSNVSLATLVDPGIIYVSESQQPLLEEDPTLTVFGNGFIPSSGACNVTLLWSSTLSQELDYTAAVVTNNELKLTLLPGRRWRTGSGPLQVKSVQVCDSVVVQTAVIALVSVRCTQTGTTCEELVDFVPRRDVAAVNASVNYNYTVCARSKSKITVKVTTFFGFFTLYTSNLGLPNEEIADQTISPTNGQPISLTFDFEESFVGQVIYLSVIGSALVEAEYEISIYTEPTALFPTAAAQELTLGPTTGGPACSVRLYVDLPIPASQMTIESSGQALRIDGAVTTGQAAIIGVNSSAGSWEGEGSVVAQLTGDRLPSERYTVTITARDIIQIQLLCSPVQTVPFSSELHSQVVSSSIPTVLQIDPPCGFSTNLTVTLQVTVPAQEGQDGVDFFLSRTPSLAGRILDESVAFSMGYSVPFIDAVNPGLNPTTINTTRNASLVPTFLGGNPQYFIFAVARVASTSTVLTPGFNFSILTDTKRPFICGVSPASGPETGGSMVLINGYNFLPEVTQCRFGQRLNQTRYVTVSGSLFAYEEWSWIQNDTFGSPIASVLNSTHAVCTSPVPCMNSTYDLAAQHCPSLPPSNWNREVDLGVSNTGDAGYSFNGAEFTYFANPTISSITPTAGPASGGTKVWVRAAAGSAFPDLASATCEFGSVHTPATLFNATILSCLAPAFSTEGFVPVRISLNQQLLAPSETELQYYAYSDIFRGSLVSIHPQSANAAGGTLVTITGADFKSFEPNPFKCGFGDHLVQPVSATSTQVVCALPTINASELATLDRAAPPTIRVQMWTNGVDGSLNSLYLSVYNFSQQTRFDSISPSFGPVSGGTVITLNGAGFINSSSMLCAMGFGVVDPPETTSAGFISSSQLQCATPAYNSNWTSSTRLNVSLSLNDGKSYFAVPIAPNISGVVTDAAASKQFKYKPEAAIIALPAPSAGPISGGDLVVITGAGLLVEGVLDAACRFGTQIVSANLTSVNTTDTWGQLSCRAPAALNAVAGAVSLEITVNRLQFSTSGYMYTYTEPIGKAGGLVNASGHFPTLQPSDFDSVLLDAFSKALQRILPTMPLSALTLVGVTSLNQTSTSRRLLTNTGASVHFEIANFGLTSDQLIALLEASFANATTGGFADTFKTIASQNGKSHLILANPFSTVALEIVLKTVLLSSHACGPSSGGSMVTLTGSGFVNSSTAIVQLSCISRAGSSIAVSTAATFVSDLQVTFVSPWQQFGNANCTGRYGVNENSFATTTFEFEYFVDPAIELLEPSAAPLAGGTLITVRMSELDASTPARCGLTPQCIFSNSNSTSPTPFEVTTSGALVLSNAGNVSSLQCSTPAVAAYYTNPSADTTLASQLQVSWNHQQRSNQSSFEFYPDSARLLTASPIQGPAGAGTLVTITGTGLFSFEKEAVCRWGYESQGFWLKVPYITKASIGATANTFVCSTPTNTSLNQPFAVAPRYQPWELPGVTQLPWLNTPLGTVQLSLAPNGVDFVNNTLPFKFFNLSQVQLQSITPDRLLTVGTTMMTISGSAFAASNSTVIRFMSATTTKYGHFDATTWTATDTQIIAPTPSFAAGAVSITISFDGQHYTDAGFAAEYFLQPEPKFLSVYLGPTTGSTRVIIHGKFFVNTGFTRCRFDGGAALIAEYITDTEIACTSPATPEPKSSRIQLTFDLQNWVDVLHYRNFTYFTPIQIVSVDPVSSLRIKPVNVTVSYSDASVVNSDLYRAQPSCRWVSSTLAAAYTSGVFTDTPGTFTCLTPENNELTGASTFSVSMNGNQNWAQYSGSYDFSEVATCWTCPDVVAPPTASGKLTIFKSTRRRRYDPDLY